MKFLSLKHWQAFLIIIIGLFLQNLTITNNPTASWICTIIGIVIYSLWPIIVGNELNYLLPKRVTVNFNFFLINVFIWLVVLIGAFVFVEEGETLTFTGLPALAFLYAIFAYFYSLAFSAKALKSIELGREANFSDYAGDFFLILFLPIGIWFLQPRLNKVAIMKRDEMKSNSEQINFS